MSECYPIQNIRRKDCYLVSALYDGLEDGSLKHLKDILVSSEANCNMILPQLGVSPLHLAVGNESEIFAEEVTRLFLQFGGNPNIRAVGGETPVHIAAAWGRANILRLLLLNGGNPWLYDGNDENAFHLAFEGRHWKVIDILKTFRLFDLVDEKDPYKEKYKLTLDKVHVFNKNIVVEYGEAPQLGYEAGHTKSIGTQTYQNTEIAENERRKPLVTLPIRHCVETSQRPYKLKPKELGDHKNNQKMVEKISDKTRCAISHTSVQKGFPQKCLKDQLLEELKKFHIKRKTDEYVFDPSNSNESIKRNISEISVRSNETKTEDGVLQVNERKLLYLNSLKTVVSESKVNNENQEQEKACLTQELGIQNKSVLVDSWVNEQHCRNQNGCINTNMTIQYNTNDFNRFSDNKRNITANDSSNVELTSDEEWIASQSCFLYFDNSEYVTCDEESPLITVPDIKTIQVPLECKEINTEYSKPQTCSAEAGCNVSSSSCESFVSISEEYKYSDEEEGVVLLEKRFFVHPVSAAYLQGDNRTTKRSSNSSEEGQSFNSDSSVPSNLDYDTDVLRKNLKDRGFIPGPIMPSTKKLYLRKLWRLDKKPVRVCTESTRVYSPELERTLHNFKWQSSLAEYLQLEKEIVQQFSQPEPERRWREGNIKSSFTYLLLDPRVTDNLPCRVETLDKLEVWSTFLSAIFYVGKGKRSRPYSHLYQAFSVWNKTGKGTVDTKMKYILDIWKTGMGVVCLHIFQNVIPVEAYTREAAIIDAIGLRNLKNARCGEYYGIASTWTSHQKRMLGTFLLYRAMFIFLHEGERQLRPGDIA